MKNRYVAKCSVNLGRLFDYELSPRFDDPRKCLEFIEKDKEIILIEDLLSRAFYKINGFYYEDNKRIEKFFFSWGSMIRVYDLVQDRFCDSFDF